MGFVSLGAGGARGLSLAQPASRCWQVVQGVRVVLAGGARGLCGAGRWCKGSVWCWQVVQGVCVVLAGGARDLCGKASFLVSSRSPCILDSSASWGGSIESQ